MWLEFGLVCFVLWNISRYLPGLVPPPGFLIGPGTDLILFGGWGEGEIERWWDWREGTSSEIVWPLIGSSLVFHIYIDIRIIWIYPIYPISYISYILYILYIPNRHILVLLLLWPSNRLTHKCGEHHIKSNQQTNQSQKNLYCFKNTELNTIILSLV